MKMERRNEEIAASLKLLASTYVQAVRQLEDTLAILYRELDLQETSWLENILTLKPTASAATSAFRPIADRETLSVLFQSKACFLGNTLLFRFFEVISRRPNRYIPHAELLDEVWGGIRSESTIRNVAKRLRDKLVSVGLSEVAQAIDGSTHGHYVLLLNQSK